MKMIISLNHCLHFVFRHQNHPDFLSTTTRRLPSPYCNHIPWNVISSYDQHENIFCTPSQCFDKAETTIAQHNGEHILRSSAHCTPHDRTVCVQASFSVKITAARGATHCRYTVFLEILDFYAMKIEVKEVKKSIFWNIFYTSRVLTPPPNRVNLTSSVGKIDMWVTPKCGHQIFIQGRAHRCQSCSTMFLALV